ncbi:MAG TPA: DUF4136 domain-containing protein [Allosphingosinicella sp.]|nr:DUF4136 domain-containing protein [Allosphingosinicella sp.]
MKGLFLRAGALLIAAALAGCATNGGEGPRAGTQATRFHLGEPIARGPIAIEAAVPAETNSPEFRAYADIVARHLTQLGWPVVNGVGSSEQVAIVNVQQSSLAERRRPPVTIGVGGGTFGWHGGVGGGISFPVGGGARPLVGTLLEVRIKRRSDGTVFWEGRATTVARPGAPDAQPVPAVEKLANLLFQDFPGDSGRTITAP